MNSTGKLQVHHGSKGTGEFLEGKEFLENVAEYSKAVIDYYGRVAQLHNQ